MTIKYEVIVAGGGHAGIEAALASARIGAKTLLLTGNIDQIGAMSCNPAVGGLAKGHLVREVDALGGEMGLAIDSACIQFRVLNASKGPAVQAYRAQADRRFYRERMRQAVENQSDITVRQGMVSALLVSGGKIIGVKTDTGEQFHAKSVIICSGTFLNGKIHIGLNQFSAGRAWEPASTGLTENLRELGFVIGRLKTGTCPRLDRNTINYEKVEEQKGDAEIKPFSFWPEGERLPQTSCHITYSNEETAKVIEDNLERSPLYTGVIEGIGPRYCPSIEDKVKRFPDKKRHQIFLEPEGLDTNEVYPNGLSTSLPVDVQVRFLRTIPGLEKVEVMRPGYAIEYDFSPPTQLGPTLQTKIVEGLFFAGQINGTSGYEEAAAQGLVAGINAVRYCRSEEPVIFTRQNSYIGVLIDDLVTKGTEEPYRMFTSRAEFRLLLRQDNADTRLCDTGYKAGLLPEFKYRRFCEKRERIEQGKTNLKKCRLTRAEKAPTGGVIPDDGILLYDYLKRPEVKITDLSSYGVADGLTDDEGNCVEIDVKFEGYIKRQEKLLYRTMESERKSIPVDFDYSSANGLSFEVIEKLTKIKPLNLGQASRISGVTPAALAILHIHLEKMSRNKV